MGKLEQLEQHDWIVGEGERPSDTTHEAEPRDSLSLDSGSTSGALGGRMPMVWMGHIRVSRPYRVCSGTHDLSLIVIDLWAH